MPGARALEVRNTSRKRAGRSSGSLSLWPLATARRPGSEAFPVDTLRAMHAKFFRRFSFVALAGAAALLAASCGTGTSPTPTFSTPGSGQDALGVIAYIDPSGCIARVDAASGVPVAAPFCPSSRQGATSVTWIDSNSAAYVTAESRALGWQLVHFDSGKTETMDIIDAPRVFLIPPQFYSSLGERLSIDQEGVVSRDDAEADVRIFPPGTKPPDASTRLVAWSPDGQWVLLSTSTDKELWIVTREGQNPRQIATKSKGVASWFMPGVGATPHADLTCSVVTSQSFGCVTPLRLPRDAAVLANSDSSTIDFTWSACPGATGYEIRIFTDNFEKPVATAFVVGTFFHQPAAALPVAELRWRVRALIGPLPAPWSEERTLAVGASQAE